MQAYQEVQVELLDQRCNRLVHEREINMQNQMVVALAGTVLLSWPILIPFARNGSMMHVP